MVPVDEQREALLSLFLLALAALIEFIRCIGTNDCDSLAASQGLTGKCAQNPVFELGNREMSDYDTGCKRNMWHLT